VIEKGRKIINALDANKARSSQNRYIGDKGLHLAKAPVNTFKILIEESWKRA
jgi:hypothetical protein